MDTARKAVGVQALHQALAAIFGVVAEANRYFAGQEPWALKKTDPARMETVLYVTAEVIRRIGILCQPFIPGSAEKLLDILAVPADERNFTDLVESQLVPGGEICLHRSLFSLATSKQTKRNRLMLVDSHCHLDFADFAEERDAIVQRALDNDIKRLVTICTRVRRFDSIIAIAEAYEGVYASVGTHPNNAHEELDVAVEELVELSKHPKVVAIGEAGLDYHYDYAPPAAQDQGFRTHIAASRITQLPLVIHARSADEDMISILREETGKGAFPFHSTLLFVGCRTCTSGRRAWWLYLIFRYSDFQKLARNSGDCTKCSARPAFGGNRCSISCTHAAPRKTQRAELRSPYGCCSGRNDWRKRG